MKLIRKNDSAITMLSLVITVIVLIILAGVTIGSLVGDDGIINAAKNQKDSIANEQKELEEEIDEYKETLANGGVPSKYEADIAGGIKDELDNFKDIIAKALSENGIPTDNDESAEQMKEKIDELAENSEVDVQQILEEEGFTTGEMTTTRTERCAGGSWSDYGYEDQGNGHWIRSTCGICGHENYANSYTPNHGAHDRTITETATYTYKKVQ